MPATATTPTPHRRAKRLGTLLGRAGLVLSITLLVLLGLGPSTGRFQVMPVFTASMSPAVPAGSLIVVRPVDPASLRVGDVVTYKIPVEDNRLVTHRIVEIVEPGATPTVRTRGDALEEPDPWTTRFAEGPAWRVAVTAPHAGRVLHALQGRTARVLMVAVAPMLLGLLLLAGIWAPKRRRDADVDSGSAAVPDAPAPPAPFDGVLVVAPGHVRLPRITPDESAATPYPGQPGGPPPLPAPRPEHDVLRELAAASSGEWTRHA